MDLSVLLQFPLIDVLSIYFHGIKLYSLKHPPIMLA